MDVRIYVLCRRLVPVTRRELAQFIKEGVYFDSVSFTPPHDSHEAATPDWQQFQVQYDSNPRPVVVNQIENSSLSATLEILETILHERSILMPVQVASRLAPLRQGFEIEFSENVSEDCWAMIDCVEAHLAREREGCVFSPDDGIYDAELQPLIRWRS